MNKFVTFLIVLLIIEAGVYSVMSTKKSFNSSPSSQTQHITQSTSSVPTAPTPAPATSTVTITPPKTTTTPPKTTTSTPKTTTSGGSTSNGSSSSSTSSPSQPGTYTATEVAKHNSGASCFSFVDGGVYDLTNWISRHPGGQSAIKYMCGIDATDAFMSQHAGERRPTSILDQYKIGTLR